MQKPVVPRFGDAEEPPGGIQQPRPPRLPDLEGPCDILGSDGIAMARAPGAPLGQPHPGKVSQQPFERDQMLRC